MITERYWLLFSCSFMSDSLQLHGLVEGIYSSEESLSIEELTHQLGMLIIDGLDVLGQFEFVEIDEKANKTNGVKIYLSYEQN